MCKTHLPGAGDPAPTATVDAPSVSSPGDGVRVTSLPAPPPNSTGRVIANALEPHEAAFAQEIVNYKGGTFVGAQTHSFPGIDGTLDGKPVSLKESQGGLGSVLKHASKAEAQATNAGFSKVDLYIKASNVGAIPLQDFASKGPLSAIPNQGTISNIHVLTKDGWVLLGGKK